MYDVSGFVHRHPGADLIITDAAEEADATHLFEINGHSDAALRVLDRLAVPGLEVTRTRTRTRTLTLTRRSRTTTSSMRSSGGDGRAGHTSGAAPTSTPSSPSASPPAVSPG